MNKKLWIVIIASLITLIGLGFWYYKSFIFPKKGIAEKCQGFEPIWSNFIDCHGVIAITDGWDIDYISIRDHIHGYEIARIYNQNQYTYKDQKIFVINRKTIESESSNGSKITYYQTLFQDGQLVQNTYDSIFDVPTYLIIDTVSGEVRTYKDISLVSKNEQSYFEEIENK